MYPTYFEKLFIWLDGKKTYFAAITLLVIPFAVGQGFITKEWGELLMGIVAILTGGGKYITDQAVINNTDLGVAIKQNRIK
jgi:hypothetical protein